MFVAYGNLSRILLPHSFPVLAVVQILHRFLFFLEFYVCVLFVAARHAVGYALLVWKLPRPARFLFPSQVLH